MQGLGTIDNPYIVTTPEEYKSISSAPTACYKLGNDIDMSSSPGLACNSFAGIFDGNGHRIIGQTGNLQSAFCRYLTNGAVVKNVGFALNLDNTSSSYTGGVAAEVMGDCTIQKVWIEPAIPGTIAYVMSTARNNYRTPSAGGIVGRITNGVVLIEDCYLADYVEVRARDYSTSAPYSPARAGGAVGSYEGGTLTLRRFYKVRAVSAVGMYSTPSYDQIIYKVGSIQPITSYNYYNRDYSNATSPYGTRKTTSEMQSQATYVTWDFVNTWKIDGGYPTLRVAVPPPKIESRTINSKIQFVFGRANINVTVSAKSIVQNLTGRITAKKIITVKSYVESINTSARRYSPSEVVIVKSIMDDIVAKVPVTWKAMTTVLSKLEPINSKADRYHLFKASRIVRSILKKIKTAIDIKIPGIGAKVRSDKIGTTDVNIGRIYDQVKVETTSPNVTVETNQGQVDTTIKYQKVIIRIGDE